MKVFITGVAVLLLILSATPGTEEIQEETAKEIVSEEVFDYGRKIYRGYAGIDSDEVRGVERLREKWEAREQQEVSILSIPQKGAEPYQRQPLDELVIEFTFYTAKCKGCTGYTRWGGYDVRDTIYYEGMRIVATDPTVIPAYSIIEFELEGEMVTAIALDIGSDIKGDRIDLLVETKEEAFKLGRFDIEVAVMEYPE